MKEAMFWKGLPQGVVQCQLCPRLCRIPGKGRGFCGVRANEGGRLYSLVYGRLCSMAMDPVEKKPLFHFAPGSRCLSVCTVGCNLDCSFCQNWQISHPHVAGRGSHSEALGEDWPPERIVEAAVRQGADGIAYTYTEPTVFYEYALDTMRLARKRGLYNVWVSNGFTSPEPAMEASGCLDAINIDLKGSDAFYRELCNAPGERAIKEAARIYRERGVWVEVTTLVIPGHNDSPGVIRALARWVKANLGPETPMHFSRFHPDFRMRDAKVTPVESIDRALRIALKEGILYAYAGNVPGHARESTLCPECGRVLIERSGFGTGRVRQECSCGHRLHVAGMEWGRFK